MALVDLKSDLAKKAGKNLSKISGRLNNPSLSDKQGRFIPNQPRFENKSKNDKLFLLNLDGTPKIYYKDGRVLGIGGHGSDIVRRQYGEEVHVGWPHTVNWPGLESYYKKALSDKDQLGMRRIGAIGNSKEQPFIIRPIGKRWHGGQQIGNTSDFIRGGSGTFVSRAAADASRLTKFFKTSQGKVFIGRQFLFQALSPRGENLVYNPLSLYSVGPLHLPRSLAAIIPPSGIYENVIAGRQNLLLKAGSFVKNIVGSFLGKDDKLVYEENVKKKQLRGYRMTRSIGDPGRVQDPKWSDVLGGPIKELVAGSKSGTLDKINMHPYGGKKSDLGINNNDNDFIPFKFRDIVNGKWLIFRAILSGIQDTITPDWSSERYVGRPDQVHVYKGADREISFNFVVYPKTRQELPVLWDKLNYLVGLTYPSWYNNSPGMSMVSPMIELTIGNMYKNTPGFLSSLTLTVEDGSTWEIDKGLQLPKHITCACSFTYIGNYLPSTVGKHFELNWMRNPVGDNAGTFISGIDGGVAEQIVPGRGSVEPTYPIIYF